MKLSSPFKNRTLLASLMLAGLTASVPLHAGAQALTPQQQHLRAIYQELVEINTTNSVGSCTVAATAMAARLKAGGYSDSDMQIVIPPGGPKKGNLVARLKGTGGAKPLLLLAHIDVVEAKREDWERDPFKLVEENGNFYARGASDDKSMAAMFVANMIRYKQENLKVKRDIIMALTCDEEQGGTEFNGVDYMLKHHRGLIDAELAINEGGSGVFDEAGKPLRQGIQAGEKVFQTFSLEVTNPGGHSSLPPPDNAIVELAEGLSRLGKFAFPFNLSDTTRGYFERMSKIETGQVAADMQAILRTPPDPAALARLYAASPFNNSTVRTTCIPTMLDGGHAENALPQRARALVNCRILPGEPVAQIQATIVNVVANPAIKVTPVAEAFASPAPPLTPKLMKVVESVSAEIWPGVPVVPALSTGATDGSFLNRAGIWTYGLSGLYRDAKGNGTHGLNEHVNVKSLYQALEFQYRLAKRLGEG